MDGLWPLGPATAPVGASDQIAGGQSGKERDPDQQPLDGHVSSLRPRWETIRTSTPWGVAFINR